MMRRLLVSGVLLTVCAVLAVGSVGRAAADAPTSYDALKALIVTQSDIRTTGMKQVGADSQDSPTSGVIEVIRGFGGVTPAGGPAFAIVSLIAGTDGSNPDTTVTNAVTSGDLLKSIASEFGVKADSFTLTGSQGVGDLDQSVQFNGTLSGDNLTFYGDSWVHGTVVGVVIYGAAPDQADSSVMQTILNAQDNLLP